MRNSENALKKRIRNLIGDTRLLSPLARLSRKGYVPYGVWNRWPVVGTFRIALPDGGSVLYRSEENRFLDRVFFWRGLESYEPETFWLFFELAREARLVLDIGANSGIYTLIACAANQRCEVISFEPLPLMHRQLVKNIEINGFAGRCTARCEAVSNTSGSSSIHYPHKDEVKASLCGDWASGGRDCSLEVTLTTIDECCSSQEAVGLVKIDVEGYEDKVLEGMSRVLEDFHPRIVMECVPDGPYKAVESILSGFGYRFYHVRRTGPVAVDSIVPDPARQERNFLCSVQELVS